MTPWGSHANGTGPGADPEENGASMTAHTSVAAEQAALERTKRRAYPAFIVIFSALVATNWLTREPFDLVVGYLYPVIVAGLLLALALLLSGRVRLRALEIGVFALATLALFVRNVDLLFRDELAPQVMLLTGAQLWSFGLVLAGAFIMFERRLAIRLGVGMLALSSLLTVAAMGLEAGRGQLVGETVLYLVRVHVLLVLLLILVAVATGLREQYHRAIERAALLEQQALTDPLTRVANRRAAQERLEEELVDGERRGRPLSVAMLDVDHFKAVNDTYGHETGDVVLREVAAALSATVRARDLVARWGGEEFLLLLPETTAGEALAIAERVRLAIAGLHPEGLRITATIGVAEAADGETAGSLLRRADLGLYAGKQDGRNQTVSDPSWSPRVSLTDQPGP